MSRSNDVFQVLVPTVDTVAAKGSALSALSVGQIGIFNYESSLAIDGTSSTADKKNSFIAIGVDPEATGSLADIRKSAGTHIPVSGLNYLSTECYKAGENKIMQLDNYQASCSTDYSVKFEIRNQQAYRVNGYNQVVKSFVVQSDDCTGCEDCPSGDVVALAVSIVNEVNSDPDQIISAYFFDEGNTVNAGAGGKYNEDELDSWVAANSGVAPIIRFEISSMAFKDFCQVNLNYFFPHSTDAVMVIGAGFEGNGSTSTPQGLVSEVGSGYDIKQMEYEAGGWNGTPGTYRVYSDGMARDGFHYYSNMATKYNTINLSYDLSALSGWRGFSSHLRTVIAVDESKTTMMSNIKNAIDAVYGSIGAVASCA